MNEDVQAMIDTLRARLDDVEAVLAEAEVEASGFATRLDKIDDALYLVQRDLEKLSGGEPVEHGEEGDDAPAEPAKKEFLTDEAKETLKDTGRMAAEALRDGKEVVSELTSTVSEFKDFFSLKKK